MALIEFQISASSLLAMLRSTAMQRKACVVGPYAIDGHQLVIDRLEFGQNRLKADANFTQFFAYENLLYGTDGFTYSGKLAQVFQDIVVHGADLDAVKAGQNVAASAPVTIVLDLGVQLTSLSTISLLVSFNRVDVSAAAALFGVSGDQLRQQLEPILSQAMAVKPIPFDIGHKVIGPTAQIENAALAVDSTLSRVAIRAEAGTSSFYLVQRWEAFINGAVEDHLQAADWSLSIDQWLLESMISLKIEDGFKTSSSDFQLVTGVGSSYSNRNGVAHVTSTFGGNVDAKVCHPWFDVTLDSDLSVPHQNKLGMDATVSWHEDPWDKAGCDLTAAFLASAVGSIAAMAVPGVAGFVNGLSGFLAGLAGAQYLQSTLTPGQHAISDCQQDTDTHYTCEKDVGLGNVPGFGALNFDTLRADNDGITLIGSIHATPLTSSLLESNVQPFEFKAPSVTCGELSGNEMADFLADPGRYVTAYATVDLEDGGTAPLFMCSTPQVLDDPLDVFDTSHMQVTGDQSPILIQWNIPIPPPAYYANPYPCRMLVETTGGVQVVTIPPVPELSQRDIDALAGELAAKIASCLKLVDSWFNHFHRFNPKWSIDPQDRVEHWWEVEVTGIAPGGEVRLIDGSGDLIVAGLAGGTQPIRLQAVTDASEKDAEISLVRDKDAVAAERGPRGIGVRQTQLVRLATIPLESSPLRLVAGYVNQKLSLLVVLPGQLDAYDLSDSTRPRLFAQRAIAGLAGATIWHGGAIAWGASGLSRLAVREGRCEVEAAVEAESVLSAFSWNELLYAATDLGVEVWSADLVRRSRVDLPGLRSVARAGRLVVASSALGLTSFVAGNAGELREVAQLADADSGDLFNVPATAGSGLFITNERASRSGGGKIVRFADDGETTDVARYQSAPWFAGLTQAGGLLVRSLAGGDQVAISARGRTAQL